MHLDLVYLHSNFKQCPQTSDHKLTSAGLNEVSTKTADSDAAVLSKNCTTDTHSNFNWASGGSTKNRLYTRAFHFVPAKQPQFSTENIFSLQFNFRFFEMFSSFLLESSFLQSPHSIFPILVISFSFSQFTVTQIISSTVITYLHYQLVNKSQLERGHPKKVSFVILRVSYSV